MSKKVFLLEDDEDTCSLISAILENYGYEPQVAFSIKEGKSILQDNAEFDLFFLDYSLPDGKSFELLENELICERSKVILCSAYLSKDKLEKAKKMGISNCLKKPINFDLLHKTITSLNEKNTDHR